MPPARPSTVDGCGKPGQIVTVHVGEIKTNPVGWTWYRGSTGAMPGYLGSSNIGEQFRIVRIKDGKIIWNDKLSFPSGTDDGGDWRRSCS